MRGLYLWTLSISKLRSARRITVVKSKPLFLRPAMSGTALCQQHERVLEIMIDPEETGEPQVANMSQASAEAVKADLVRMHQSAAETVKADEVGLQQSAAVAVKAGAVSAHQSALVAVEAEEVLSQRSTIVNVQAEKASVNGYTGAVLARNAEVHYGLTGLVIGQDVHLEGARTILLLGRNVSGNVTTVLDARTALIAGLTSGLFAGLLLLLGRMLFGRK